MQYGGNAVPYLKDSLEVRNYANHLLSQIKWLKRRKPNTNILFIGPTDLSTSINGKMVTYKLLPYLNQTLKETCITNNVAYWNMFNAMGGKNSMPKWVNAEPSLAASDYIHFSPKGAKKIAEEFNVKLFDMYNEYKGIKTKKVELEIDTNKTLIDSIQVKNKNLTN